MISNQDDVLTEFSHNQFGVLRAVLKDASPWFVAKDVAEVLGYTDTDKAIRTHCKSKQTYPADLAGQVRHIAIIPESDLYRLVLRSNLPTAKEFGDWVVEDVLPSIRKTGGYIHADASETGEEILAKGALAAQLTIQRLNAQIEAVRGELTEVKRKADFFDKYMFVKKGFYTPYNAARILGIRPKKFIQYLLDKKYILRVQGILTPPARYLQMGWFSIRVGSSDFGPEPFQTYVTPRGLEALAARAVHLTEEAYLERINSTISVGPAQIAQ